MSLNLYNNNNHHHQGPDDDDDNPAIMASENHHHHHNDGPTVMPQWHQQHQCHQGSEDGIIIPDNHQKGSDKVR